MNLGLPWFGPKSAGSGWGWTPVTWQGWFVTALFTILILGMAFLHTGRHRALAILAIVGVYLALVIMTGTKPGGSLFG